MKRALLTLFTLCSFANFAAGTDLLMSKEGADIDLSYATTVQKHLNLDNPFLIQLYGTSRSMGRLTKEQDIFVNLVFNKEHEKALALVDKVNRGRFSSLALGSELYLLYQLGHFQNFFNRFIEVSSFTNFFKTEMGIALDQMVSKESSALLVDYGFIFSDAHLKMLEKTVGLESRVNYSLQAFKALRDGKGALPWISKLNKNDVLRIRLAQSALLEFAREGKLAASAKLIREVIEPHVEESTEKEEIALYYITLARLLYQAGAFTESKQYYYSIPESSKYFLSARSEALWILIQERNYSKAMGEVASLDLSLFDDRFYPEVYLVSTMANVLMCQFSDAKKGFERFVAANQVWAKKIENHLSKSSLTPALVDRVVTNIERNLISIEEERRLMERTVALPKYVSFLDQVKLRADKVLASESLRQWENRKSVLDATIYKMKFVKVEFISRMREVALARKEQFTDKVSVYQAARAKKSQNELVFPHDDVPWGDDLFHMTADVVNQCVKMFDKGSNQ